MIMLLFQPVTIRSHKNVSLGHLDYDIQTFPLKVEIIWF